MKILAGPARRPPEGPSRTRGPANLDPSSVKLPEVFTPRLLVTVRPNAT